MEKRKLTFILFLVVLLLTSCNYEEIKRDNRDVEDGHYETEKVTQDVDTKEDTVQKIAHCLWEQVPELEDWSVYVEKESGGKAYLYQSYGNEKEDVYRNGEGSEYLGKYYSVYVGEMWGI